MTIEDKLKVTGLAFLLREHLPVRINTFLSTEEIIIEIWEKTGLEQKIKSDYSYAFQMDEKLDPEKYREYEAHLKRLMQKK